MVSAIAKTGSQHKTPYKNFRVEHMGIQGEVLDKRRGRGHCTRCGKEGHLWLKCPAPKPVVVEASTSSSSPKKWKQTTTLKEEEKEEPAKKKVDKLGAKKA